MMCKYLIISCLVYFGAGANTSSEVKRVFKTDFEQGVRPVPLRVTKTLYKQGHLLRVPGCGVALRDNLAVDDLTTYEYMGELAGRGGLRLVKEEHYNGEEYRLYDASHGCREYHLLGKPYAAAGRFVTFNESETTDRNPVTMESWLVTPSGVLHLKTTVLPRNLWHVDVRFSANATQVIIKDHLNQYWKVAF